jgi:hypothetical protein
LGLPSCIFPWHFVIKISPMCVTCCTTVHIENKLYKQYTLTQCSPLISSWMLRAITWFLQCKTWPMSDFKFSRRRVWCSELSALNMTYVHCCSVAYNKSFENV